MKDTYMT